MKSFAFTGVMARTRAHLCKKLRHSRTGRFLSQTMPFLHVLFVHNESYVIIIMAPIRLLKFWREEKYENRFQSKEKKTCVCS